MTSPRSARLSPGEFPPAVDSILSPVQGVGERIAEIDLDILQDDIQQAPTRLQRWVGGLDDAAGTIAPPPPRSARRCSLGRLRTCRCSPSSCPGRWSVGVAYLVAAVNKYGTDPNAEVKDDLAAAARRGGDAVKKLAGK